MYVSAATLKYKCQSQSGMSISPGISRMSLTRRPDVSMSRLRHLLYKNRSCPRALEMTTHKIMSDLKWPPSRSQTRNTCNDWHLWDSLSLLGRHLPKILSVSWTLPIFSSSLLLSVFHLLVPIDDSLSYFSVVFVRHGIINWCNIAGVVCVCLFRGKLCYWVTFECAELEGWYFLW